MEGAAFVLLLVVIAQFRTIYEQQCRIKNAEEEIKNYKRENYKSKI